MVINLTKGQNIVLEKDQYDLSSVTVGLGWDVARKRAGFSQIFLRNGDNDFDLDAIAFLLDANGKVANDGNANLEGGDIVFYNSLRHSSGNIYHTGDNRTGEGDGDDEQLMVNLSRMESKYEKIVFLVSIYEGLKRHQSFGQVENAFIRAVDARGLEIFRYDLSRDSSFADKCSMIFGEFYRHNGAWKFKALGTPYETDDFQKILEQKYL